jgi:hypothetical protein
MIAVTVHDCCPLLAQKRNECVVVRNVSPVRRVYADHGRATLGELLKRSRKGTAGRNERGTNRGRAGQRGRGKQFGDDRLNTTNRARRSYLYNARRRISFSARQRYVGV